jgi:polyhydroxyalkanoate synthesis regulator phasin
MPQPKSSRSSSSRARKPAAKSTAAKPASTRAAASKPAARSAASKPAAKRAAASRSAASKPAAKRAAAKKPAATSRASAGGATASKTSTREEAVRANLSALRDTLRKGVVLTADGVKATLDDAVKRGRITRKDATELSQNLLSSGRSQADGFRADLEQLLGRGRDRAALSSDRVLQEVDRARRRVGVGPSFPITLYDELNASQISSRLKDLTPAQLRKVRDHEKRHDNRKTVLSAIEKRLA